ncbi:hypothetical protein V5E97_06725 [Singulisphaera sp. Ch08]|uniref:Uncharacterized protein n=1 Tax=Singulisphaera sp. Ch08 TaxID=3120278 RepID=A0AAU7CKR5_9BACT
MSTTVSGRFQASVSLTTNFTSGTAGTATESNQVGTSPIEIGASKPAGRQFTDVWSQTYTNVSAPFDVDLTALAGVGGRTVNFTTPGIRLIQAINSDPTAGHDFKIGPGSSNGFAAPWPGTGAYQTVYGGMPGAAVVDGKPTGNTVFHSICKATALAVDATHKVITIDPGASTITSLTLVFAG